MRLILVLTLLLSSFITPVMANECLKQVFQKIRPELQLGSQTISGTSGVEVDGSVSRFLNNKDGSIYYFNTAGPTTIRYRGVDLPGQGGDYHAQGFGSPVGKLVGQSKKIEDLTPDELKKMGIETGKVVTLKYQSGVTVKGLLTETVNRDGKNILMVFKDATATGPDGVILFDPSWGTFDMTIMDTIQR